MTWVYVTTTDWATSPVLSHFTQGGNYQKSYLLFFSHLICARFFVHTTENRKSKRFIAHSREKNNEFLVKEFLSFLSVRDNIPSFKSPHGSHTWHCQWGHKPVVKEEQVRKRSKECVCVMLSSQLWRSTVCVWGGGGVKQTKPSEAPIRTPKLLLLCFKRKEALVCRRGTYYCYSSKWTWQ